LLAAQIEEANLDQLEAVEGQLGVVHQQIKKVKTVRKNYLRSQKQLTRLTKSLADFRQISLGEAPSSIQRESLTESGAISQSESLLSFAPNSPEMQLLAEAPLLGTSRPVQGFIPSYATPTIQPHQDNVPINEEEIIPETVFGGDQRRIVRDPEVFTLPWQMVCALDIDTNLVFGRATGFIIGKRTILTAAHNLYDIYLGQKRVTSRIGVYPGRYRTVTKNGLFEIVSNNQFYIPQAWIDSIDHGNADANFDYGLIFLSQDFGSQTGKFELAALSDQELTGRTATLAGYPAGIGSGVEQVFAMDKIDLAQGNLLFYKIDATIGQSGSPIWVQNLSSGQRIALGIHTVSGSSSNQGTRISSSIRSDIVSRIQ
jgi:V8-like Glu-specific endopeptidase